MRLGFRNCLIGDEVLVEPSVCKINYEIKHGMYAHVTPGGMRWNSCKQIQNSFAVVAAYPRPHQDSLLRNSPVTKYLKSHSADGQHYKFVSELLRRSKTHTFSRVCFSLDMGNTIRNCGQNCSASSGGYWPVVWWLVLGCEIIMNIMTSNAGKDTIWKIWSTLSCHMHTAD